MKKKTHRVLNCILILVLLFGITKFTMSELEKQRSQKDSAQALQIAGILPEEEMDPTEPSTVSTEETTPPPETQAELPDDPIIQELLNIDLNALREENEDVIGWIFIPETKVNYPLLQWTDNDFYLNHTWTQSRNASGSIFMEYQNKPDFSDFNTIIYGHNMRGGEMFGSLHHYRWPNYWEKHPYVYIVNDDGVFRFDVFAAQSASTESVIYGLGIETDQRKSEFIRFARDYSFFETDIIPTTEDHILTLSTCTGGGHANRWVLLSVLNQEASYKRPEC